MKCILFSCSFLMALSISAQRYQLGLYGFIDLPSSNLMPNMNNNVGIGGTFSIKPKEFYPIVVELDLSNSFNSGKNYHFTTNQYYSKTMNYSINYRTHFNTYLIGVKWTIGKDYHILNGFITPQIGLASFNTTMNYPDFYHDHDHDNDFDYKTTKFQRSIIPVYGARVGIELSLNNLFKKSNKNDDRIQISVNYLRGFTDLRYINLNNVNVQPSEGGRFTPETLNFPKNSVVTQTNFAELYKTKLSLIGIQIGYIMRF